MLHLRQCILSSCFEEKQNYIFSTAILQTQPYSHMITSASPAARVGCSLSRKPKC